MIVHFPFLSYFCTAKTIRTSSEHPSFDAFAPWNSRASKVKFLSLPLFPHKDDTGRFVGRAPSFFNGRTDESVQRRKEEIGDADEKDLSGSGNSHSKPKDFMHKFHFFSLLVLLGYAHAHAQKPEGELDSTLNLQEAVVSSRYILGSKFKARNRTGSAYYVSPEEIKKYGYSDINRMLKAVPGVNLYEEDGFGLRPNISLRGTKAERSERITLMEDGILAAPAPYAAPAAYYFPNAARMYAIEVLKGSSQVQYGPFTTGGAINLVSTPVPRKFTGNAKVSFGSYNTLKTHAMVGDMKRNYGYLVEFLRYQSDGFKKYDDRKGDGFLRHDVITKFLVKTDKAEGVNHSLELKYGFAHENSDESYLGLTEKDFAQTPYLRYAGSQMDHIRTFHHQFASTYLLTFNPYFKVTTNAYHNYFYRNWYKLNDVKAGHTKAEKRSIGQVLNDPETNRAYYDIVTGKTDYAGEALILRANRRSYRSRGIQSKAEYRLWGDGFFWDFELGLRYHTDEEDRFQWEDAYSMIDRQMHLFHAGVHGSQSNRITSATAFASYLLAKLRYRNWTFTSGVRYEDVELLKKDYGKQDPTRTGKRRIETPNHARALIPGIGVNYQIAPSASVFFGIHKGFAPPSAELYQKAESSVNMELGTRLRTGGLTMELIGFHNRYDNMLGSDLAAAGGLGTLEQFNVGEALVQGAEFLMQYRPLPRHWQVQLPLQLSYTYTDTQMRNSFESNAWGVVRKGDEIPYIYKHALNAQIGLSYKRFEANVGMRYNGDMRTIPGQERMAEREKIPSTVIWDASVKMDINKQVSVALNAINLTNKKYLASRHPSGMRAGHPFGIYGAVHVQF